jgi:hypothetical protein
MDGVARISNWTGFLLPSMTSIRTSVICSHSDSFARGSCRVRLR